MLLLSIKMAAGGLESTLPVPQTFWSNDLQPVVQDYNGVAKPRLWCYSNLSKPVPSFPFSTRTFLENGQDLVDQVLRGDEFGWVSGFILYEDYGMEMLKNTALGLSLSAEIVIQFNMLGGKMVQSGCYQGVVTPRQEQMLYSQLGVLNKKLLNH